MQEEIKNFFKDHWFKIVLIIFIPLIIILLFYFFTVYPRQQQKTIYNVELKNKCDNQSVKIFNDIKKNVNSINYTYKNHYINSLKRCYILIHGTGITGIGMSDILIDVFTEEEIANCESYSSAPEIDFCSYHDSVKVKYDLNQFNDFIKPYMETE